MNSTRILRTRVELQGIVLHTLRQLRGLELITQLKVERVPKLPGQAGWDVAAIVPVISDISIAARAHQAIEQLRIQFELKD